MPLFQNFTPGSLPASGLLIPNGAARHDIALAIAANIISISGGKWLEVTGAGPTPAALQPLASSGLSVGGTTDQSTTVHRHVTLYDALDPQLPNFARCIRISIGATGLVMAIYDPFTIGVIGTNNAAWSVQQSVAQDQTNTGYLNKADSIDNINTRQHYVIGFLDAAPSQATGSLKTNILGDHRVLIAGGDDFLYIRSIRVSDNAYAGMSYIPMFADPADGHWTRSQLPSIALTNPSANLNEGSHGGTNWSDATGILFPGCPTRTFGLDPRLHKLLPIGGHIWNNDTLPLLATGVNAPSGNLALIKAIVTASDAVAGHACIHGIAPGVLMSQASATTALYTQKTLSNGHVYQLMSKTNAGWWVRIG